MLAIFLMASSPMKPVPNSNAAAATKSDKVQCTSSVNRIAMNGIHNSSADVSMMIKSLFLFKIKMYLRPISYRTSIIIPFYRNIRANAIDFQALYGTKPNLQFKRATESPGCIVRLCAIVIYEDMAVPVIGKDRATMLSDFNRGFQPARCFRIENSKLL